MITLRFRFHLREKFIFLRHFFMCLRLNAWKQQLDWLFGKHKPHDFIRKKNLKASPWEAFRTLRILVRLRMRPDYAANNKFHYFFPLVYHWSDITTALALATTNNSWAESERDIGILKQLFLFYFVSLENSFTFGTRYTDKLCSLNFAFDSMIHRILLRASCRNAEN